MQARSLVSMLLPASVLGGPVFAGRAPPSKIQAQRL